METGLNLFAVLEDSRKLISRNNLISDKLPYTLGTIKDDYLITVLERWASSDLKQNNDDQIAFSKTSVAYFFRIFIVEVKIKEIIQYLETEVKEYVNHKETLKEIENKMLAIEFEDIKESDIEEAYKVNELVKTKMNHFNGLVNEYTEVNQLQKIGVDRF